MVAVHPGRLLKREHVAREVSANKLALALHVPSGRITSILNGKRAITPETALRLGRYFGNSAQFWMNLQTRYDLSKAERELGKADRFGSRTRCLAGEAPQYRLHDEWPKWSCLGDATQSIAPMRIPLIPARRRP